VVRPDIVWSQSAAGSQSSVDVVLASDHQLVAALRERARRRGVTLEQQLDALLRAAGESEHSQPRPPIQLTTVRTSEDSTWSRSEIYGDEGR
jgi:hypothetical protein